MIVRGTKERLKVKVALSNSFGFGGHNSSIPFAPYHPDGVAAAIEEIEREADGGQWPSLAILWPRPPKCQMIHDVSMIHDASTIHAPVVFAR